MTDVPTPPEHFDAPDLFRGGLLYRVMHRFGVDPAHASRTARRAVLVGFLLWAPMAVAALIEGVAWPGTVRVPFLLDVAAYVRPLVVVPALLAAEPILATTWRHAGARFRGQGIVGPECVEAYDALVARVTRRARSPLPEVVCLVLAAVLAFQLATAVRSAPRDAWFAPGRTVEASRLSFAGLWAAFAVHGVLFYLALRWIWLVSLWYRFLLGVARLPLHLYPAHPDRAAGLGFVGWTLAGAAPLIFSWSAGTSSAVANRMIHHGAHLQEFAPAGGVLLVLVLLLFVLPPALVFAPLLARTRRRALEDWSRKMARFAEADDADQAAAEAATGLGAAVSSLQDFEVAVSTVRSIRPFPVALNQVVGPLVAFALPVAPLLFLAFPAREILGQLLRLVM